VKALDELHFGPHRTLNLRESLPTAVEAKSRAERWLREQQVKGSADVLIVTGRGNQSIGGVAVLKEAIVRLLGSLKRQGVVASHREHNPGAVVVTLAPLRALSEAAPRRRDPVRAKPTFDFAGLSEESAVLLRELAEIALAELGIVADERRLRDEMHRQLGVVAAALPPSADTEAQLKTTLRAMIAEYD
jgi:hypothetical protein